LFITVGHPRIRQSTQWSLQNPLYEIIHCFLRIGFRFVEIHRTANDVATEE